MKYLAIALICLPLPFFTQAQGSEARKDTIKNKIQVTPYLSLDENSSSFIKTISDSSTLQFSSGISLFNTLRGHIPNLTLPSYALLNYPAGLRNYDYNSSIVLDGISYFKNLADYLPLNTFDYSSITAVSNSSALATLNNGLPTGAILLKSKSGKDITKPTVELNSYTTYGFAKSPNNLTTGTNKNSDLNLANSIAFMQDFGAIDTRISFTHLDAKSYLNDNSTKQPSQNLLRVNTGFELNEKLQMRLLLTNNFIRNHSNQQRNTTLPQTNFDTKENFFSGNYFTQYQITEWLTANAQYNFAQATSKEIQTSTLGEVETNKLNSYQAGNLVIRANKNLNNWSFNSFGGILFTNISYQKLRTIDNINTGELNTISKSVGLISSAEVALKNVWFTQAQYRLNRYSILENDTKSNYSIGTSLFFSRLMNLAFLSSGKLRSNYSTQYILPYQEFPSIDIYPNPIKYDQNNFIEVGIDLSFLKSKLDFTFNYFYISPKQKGNLVVTDPATGFSVTYFNTGEAKKNGLEFMITGRPVISNKISYEISGIWSNYRVLITDANNSGVPSFLPPSPYPKWRASLVNKLTWNNIVLSFLIEGNKGGTIFTTTPTPGGWGFSALDASYITLRDVSIGYQLPTEFISRLKLTQSWFSLSLRNMITSNKEISTDPYPIQKSISANLYFVF